MNQNNINVMYVEDDEFVNNTISDLLRKLDYNVYNFYNGVDAFDYFKENRIDIVISDINMPKMNGIDLVKKIKSINLKTPVIFTTAMNDEKYLLDSISLKIDRYMKKPIDCKELKENIDEVLLPFILEEENRKKDELIKQQSRDILIAKTVSMISHQWRQPLSKIGTITSKLRIYSQLNKLTQERLFDNLEKIENENKYLSSTINKFNSILEKKVSYEFSLLSLFSELKNSDYVLDIEKDIIIKSNYEEFKEVFKNIINNSYEQFENKKIKKPKITITSYSDNEFFNIKIIDNAGGIDDNILEKVFDLYYSEESLNSRGLGLFLSKLTLTLLVNAQISLENIEFLNEKGVCVKIKIPNNYIKEI
ncbi:MAG: response regulator [Sphaerochaetaceae bacterium]|nr:response regulator [Sphaerochaetaceae bacterium]